MAGQWVVAHEDLCGECGGNGRFGGWDREERCSTCGGSGLSLAAMAAMKAAEEAAKEQTAENQHRSMVRAALASLYTNVAFPPRPPTATTEDEPSSADQTGADADAITVSTAAVPTSISASISGAAALTSSAHTHVADAAASAPASATRPEVQATVPETEHSAKSSPPLVAKQDAEAAAADESTTAAAAAASNEPECPKQQEAPAANKGEEDQHEKPQPAEQVADFAVASQVAQPVATTQQSGLTSAAAAQNFRGSSRKELLSDASKAHSADSKKPLLDPAEKDPVLQDCGTAQKQSLKHFQDLEGQRAEDTDATSEAVTTSQRFVAFGKCFFHVTHLGMMVWVCVQWSDWQPNSCKDVFTGDCLYKNLELLKFYATVVLVPFVLYETFKHWYSASYFPMTFSDAFHEAFYGEKVDRNPGTIRRGTMVAMVFMSVCLSILSLANFLEVIFKLCPGGDATCKADYHAMTATMKLILWLQIGLYFMVLLLRTRSLFFTALFVISGTILFILSGVLTLGIGWVVICCLFSNGGIRKAGEGSRCGCIANGVYNFIAYFYTRV